MPTATTAIARWLINTDAWQLHLPATAPLLAQAQLAPYAHYLGLATTATPATHHYQLDAQSLSRAAAHNLGLPTLATALAGLGLTLRPAHWQQLHAWHSLGQALHLALYPVLRTASASQLAQLWQTPATRALINELLSPTTATLNTDLATAAHTLRQAGWPVALPAANLKITTSSHKVTNAQRTAKRLVSWWLCVRFSSFAVPQPWCLMGTNFLAAGGALWLAGQLTRRTCPIPVLVCTPTPL